MNGPFAPRRSSERTTANTLAAYRDELLASGFSADEVRELVSIAAQNMDELKVHPIFADRAEVPVPILLIENHEPGSQGEAEAYARFKRETST